MVLKSKYTEQQILSGDAIKCEECGHIAIRLQFTHFVNKCSGNCKTMAEYKNKYPNALTIAPNFTGHILTKENFIKKYGKEQGEIKWKSHCDKQAYTNSFEYKQEKYGWTKEQFDEYNKSRVVTEQNQIKKHGEILGKEKYNSYIDQQRYTCSEDYFIKTYGEIEGKEKFKKWNKIRSTNGNGPISELENEVFDIFDGIFGKNKRQLSLKNDIFQYKYDYANENIKRIIEFNGTYWHCDPRKYDKDYLLKGKLAEEI